MNIVYVASPYAGDVEQNVKNAREYCRYTMEQGNIPLASHLLYPQILNDSNPAERSLGTQMGLELISRCDELWASLSGRSRWKNWRKTDWLENTGLCWIGAPPFSSVLSLHG